MALVSRFSGCPLQVSAADGPVWAAPKKAKAEGKARKAAEAKTAAEKAFGKAQKAYSQKIAALEELSKGSASAESIQAAEKEVKEARRQHDKAMRHMYSL